MSDSVSMDLQQFVVTNRQDILAARESVLASNFGSLSEILDRVQESPAVKRLTGVVATSSTALDGLVADLEAATPGMKIIAGLSIVGAGAIVMGAKFALAPLIAVCLIAYGISIALPAAWDLVARKMDQWWQEEVGV